MSPSKTKASSKAANSSKASSQEQQQQQKTSGVEHSTSTSASEFPDSKIAVGAALTYIEELQKSLPPKHYEAILTLLNSYYTYNLNEKEVYKAVRDVLKHEKEGEKLLKGFERFLPEGAIVTEEEEAREKKEFEEMVKKREEEMEKERKESGIQALKEGQRITEILDDEEGDEQEKKEKDEGVAKK